jgi:Domain of unknown function (DUF4185)
LSRILKSLIQSDFGRNFEAVIQEGDQLRHWLRDNNDPALPWKRGEVIVPQGVAAAGSIIQSDFKTAGHGNFEVVVPLFAPDHTQELWHFFHDNSSVNLPWQRGQRIATNVAGPGSIIQSDFRSADHGNFEVVVPIGSSLVHFFHDNSSVNLPWQRGQTITDAARGWGCVIQSDLGSGDHGNFEVLAEECTQSVVAYWHPNQNVNLLWIQGDVLLGEPYPARRVTSARKVVQLTGEYDRQGWSGQGAPPFAMNRTESRFGIRGCDLGASFEHKNRVYFLFGDTWRVNQTPAEQDLDSIAFCTDVDPSSGLNLTFLTRPRPLLPPPLFPAINQHGFNVPMDGVSWDGAMYVFFSTDSYQVDGHELMGRSVLGRSDNDGFDYVYISEFSRRKFINVSVEPGTIDEEAAKITGFALGTPVLWIWGSGRYRASNIYLAVMPLARIEDIHSVLYFAGGIEWSVREDDAAPLLCAGDVGELSVRWNPFLARWLALFNSGNPRGILMHSAPQPWGPWSADLVMVFDPTALANSSDPCSGAGYGRFMHIPWNIRVCDHVQDDMFTQGYRENEWGGEYGPYQITRYAAGMNREWSQIWFTMSTWNPYQAMLMTATITNDLV